jgi:hypothetical protein
MRGKRKKTPITGAGWYVQKSYQNPHVYSTILWNFKNHKSSIGKERGCYPFPSVNHKLAYYKWKPMKCTMPLVEECLLPCQNFCMWIDKTFSLIRNQSTFLLGLLSACLHLFPKSSPFLPFKTYRKKLQPICDVSYCCKSKDLVLVCDY